MADDPNCRRSQRRDLRKLIGEALRWQYEDVLREPIPERLRDIIERFPPSAPSSVRP
jgi:hypothetical protein